MKSFFYMIFALFFNISRIIPVKKGRVALLAPHNGGKHDSLGEIRRCLEKKDCNDIHYISTSQLGSISGAIKFFFVSSRILATSEYVFMNDNFMPMASLNFSDKSKVVQLWHAEGAFKKFGLMTELSPEIRVRQEKSSSKLSFVVCSSESVAPVYAEAFGVDINKVLPLGSPRTDYLIRGEDTERLRQEFDAEHPECNGKKLVLYAPTFRDNPDEDKELIGHIDYEKFRNTLGDEYSLLIKLHPQIHTSEIPQDAINVTGCDIADLTLICDMVVTDYSSVCMNFALLSKPCFFYAFDLEKYKDDRSFCFGYEDYVPGPIVRDFDSLIRAIKDNGISEKLISFRNFNFDCIDDKNTERVINKIMNI